MEGQRGSVVSSDGTPIGFLTAGSGPALLLVHGGMNDLTRWQPVWPLLTGRHRVTAMDRRGRGSSGDGPGQSLAREYDDVTAVAEQLARGQGGPIDVFGHSYGAVCALGAAARGGPFRRLALYEPPGPETVPRDWLERMKALIADGRSERAMGSFLIEIIGVPPEVVRALRDTPIASTATDIVASTMVREAAALLTVDLAELARAVPQPVLLLLGETSPPWASAITSSLARVLGDGRLLSLPGLGHEAIDTAPETVDAAMSSFFGG
ncbi:MAG: alpha/beta hydrolase [Actinomycetota bacterium]|nr:alpha/beta hydrolase [Actinomycetota bacterium]